MKDIVGDVVGNNDEEKENKFLARSGEVILEGERVKVTCNTTHGGCPVKDVEVFLSV